MPAAAFHHGSVAIPAVAAAALFAKPASTDRGEHRIDNEDGKICVKSAYAFDETVALTMAAATAQGKFVKEIRQSSLGAAGLDRIRRTIVLIGDTAIDPRAYAASREFTSAARVIVREDGYGAVFSVYSNGDCAGARENAAAILSAVQR